MIIIILCLQPPHTQRLIIVLGNEKDVGAVHLAYPDFVGSGKPLCKDKQPVSPRQEILYTSTAHPKHIQLLYMQRWRPWYKITHVDVPIALSSCIIRKFTRFSKSEDKTFCKRPFLMSWRWCLHEALPYVHQTNMSWKHSPTHGLTAFKGKIKKNFWLNKIFHRFFIEEKLFTKVLFSWYWRPLWQLLTNIICQCYISCLKLS